MGHICKQNCKQDNWKTRVEMDQMLTRTQALNQIKFLMDLFSQKCLYCRCPSYAVPVEMQVSDSEKEWS